jgi:hypothetical protein
MCIISVISRRRFKRFELADTRNWQAYVSVESEDLQFSTLCLALACIHCRAENVARDKGYTGKWSININKHLALK